MDYEVENNANCWSAFKENTVTLILICLFFEMNKLCIKAG